MRVASYNTRDFLDDSYAAARVVRAIAPDVLCLQEVPRRWWSGWRVAAFARHCEMRWPGRHRGSGGTTIFVSPRIEMVQAMHQRLHVARLQRSRGFAFAQVSVAGSQRVGVASVHLSLSAPERVEHARTIMAAMSAGVGTGHMVVAGDLNESASGGAWEVFARTLRPVGPSSPSFPAVRPRHALDVIFASPGLEVGTGSGRDPVELNERDIVAASDHRPVWVDLEVPAIA